MMKLIALLVCVIGLLIYGLISQKLSRRDANLACIAGVLTSLPNRSPRGGRKAMKPVGRIRAGQFGHGVALANLGIAKRSLKWYQ